MMFDIRKRSAFQTVEELRDLLKHLPAHTRICICGDANCFFHEELDASAVCLDCEDLQEHYDEIALHMEVDDMSIEERNQLVLTYLWCIDSVIRQNYGLVQAAHLDQDDVYQFLAIRLIRAVELYKPGARSMKGYIFNQLKFELLNCKSAKRRYGFSAAPYDLRDAVVSLDALVEADPYWELHMMKEANLCVS